MKQLITTLLMLTIATPTIAQTPPRWRFLGGNPTQSAYIDDATVQRKGDRRIFFLRIETTQGSGVAWMELDCRNRLIRDYPDDEPWRSIRPGTVGQTAFRDLCR